MDCTLTQHGFAELTTETAAVAQKRSALPVLSMLRLTCNGEQLRATGSDLETTLSLGRELLATPQTEAGGCCADAPKLAAIAKRLPGGANVRLRLERDKLTIRSGRSRWTLSTQPWADYPEPDQAGDPLEATIATALLRTGIQAVAYAIARNDVRYYLNGLLLEVAPTGEVDLVATDGHRLAHHRLSEPLADLAPSASGGAPTRDDLPRQIIIPELAVKAILHLAERTDTINLKLTPRAISLEDDDSLWLHCKLIDARYPDWRRVIPGAEKLPYSAQVEIKALSDAAQRVLINSHGQFRGLRCLFSADQLLLQSTNEAKDDAEDSLELATSAAGSSPSEPVSIGLNGTYLLDALSALRHESDLVLIRYDNGDNSLLLTPVNTDSGSRSVLMPMRL